MRVAHISDLHFGRLSSAHIQEDLIASIRAAGCDAVILTGDLTQRARRSEFRAARAFLNALPKPLLVIPGNHDAHAWWHHPELRIFNPFGRYKKWISKDLEQNISCEGLAVLGLNTAHGLTVKGGRCTIQHTEKVYDYFLQQSPDAFKVLAVHHPLLALQPSKELDVARNGEDLVQAAVECGVDVVCAGHWHLPHIELCNTISGRILVSVAGTATSDRGRFSHDGGNSWIRLEKTSQGIETQYYIYAQESRTFNLIEHTRYLPDGQDETIA